jgi:hypothetical protein
LLDFMCYRPLRKQDAKPGRLFQNDPNKVPGHGRLLSKNRIRSASSGPVMKVAGKASVKKEASNSGGRSQQTAASAVVISTLSRIAATFGR